MAGPGPWLGLEQGLEPVVGSAGLCPLGIGDAASAAFAPSAGMVRVVEVVIGCLVSRSGWWRCLAAVLVEAMLGYGDVGRVPGVAECGLVDTEQDDGDFGSGGGPAGRSGR